MNGELADTVSQTHWAQIPVRRLGGLAWIDRQHASFQNANNEISTSRNRHAEERWNRSKVSGSVGGNVFGSQLGPAEESAVENRGQVLLFADFATTPKLLRCESWLDEALKELSSCPDNAIEEGLEAPSELGLIKAEELIADLAIHVESQPDIYPMDQGSIAIDIRHPNAKVGVLCLVERDGSGVLFSRSQRAKGRIRVGDALDLLKEGGLSEMRRMGIGL